LAKGLGAGLLAALGTTFLNFGTVVVDSGANWTVQALATALAGATVTGSGGSSQLEMISAGTFSLGGVSRFATVTLGAGNNTVTVTDTTLSGGTVALHDGSSGNNSVSAAGDTSASKGKTLSYFAGTGTDSFVGGFENDKVTVSAASLGADTLTAGTGTNTLTLTGAGTFSLGGVSRFATVTLGAGNNTVTVTDTTLSGGTVALHDGSSGNNSVSAAGDTSASKGKTLSYFAGTGTDSFVGGFENDSIHVSAAAVTADKLTGGTGNNTLILTSAANFSLGGISNFATVDLAAGNNTVTVADTTLSGGSVLLHDGASGNNVVSAVDTTASKGMSFVYVAGKGTDSFTGGFENDTVFMGTGSGTFTAGSGSDSFVFSANNLPTQKLNSFQVSADDLLVYGTHVANGFNLGSTDNGMNPLVPTLIDPTIFTTNSSGSFTSSNQRFAYDTATGNLYYSATGSNTSERTVATLAGAPSITATDIFFEH
jgi:hypothetical protein